MATYTQEQERLLSDTKGSRIQGRVFLWTPFMKQRAFLECPAFEVCYGGAAGGGKTDALLIAALMGVKNAGWTALIVRRNLVDMEKGGGIIDRSKVLYRGRGHYDGNKRRWVFGNDRIIEFGHCKTQADLEKYYSSQYTFIGVEQGEQFTEHMYTFFFSRVRTTNPDIRCQVRMTVNPVGVGKGWIKKRFWIGERRANTLNEVTESVMLPDNTEHKFTYKRAFIPSTVFENPYIMKNDPQYVLRLSQMRPELVRALRDGDWNVSEGTFFSEWSEGRHVCDSFEVPSHWKRSISFDWGYSDPTCVLWFAEDPATGIIYCYREKKVDHMIDVDVASLIANESEGEDIYAIYYPWDLDFVNPQTGVSMRERMDETWKQLGKRYFLKVANKDRMNGWSSVRHYLSLRPDGLARMKVFRTCRYLIDSLPQQVTDPNKPEDLDTNGDDHAVDALRYFSVMNRRPIEKVKVEKVPQFSELAKVPVDVGGSIRMGRNSNEFRFKREPAVSFNWMME